MWAVSKEASPTFVIFAYPSQKNKPPAKNTVNKENRAEKIAGSSRNLIKSALPCDLDKIRIIARRRKIFRLVRTK